MKIYELIEKLNLIKNKVGGDKEIVFVNVDGENDIFAPKYPIVGDFEDCDGNEYTCAFIVYSSGDEFTKKEIPHYKWNPKENKIEE